MTNQRRLGPWHFSFIVGIDKLDYSFEVSCDGMCKRSSLDTPSGPVAVRAFLAATALRQHWSVMAVLRGRITVLSPHGFPQGNKSFKNLGTRTDPGGLVQLIAWFDLGRVLKGDLARRGVSNKHQAMVGLNWLVTLKTGG